MKLSAAPESPLRVNWDAVADPPTYYPCRLAGLLNWSLVPATSEAAAAEMFARQWLRDIPQTLPYHIMVEVAPILGTDIRRFRVTIRAVVVTMDVLEQ